jgi:hypothetical protein
VSKFISSDLLFDGGGFLRIKRKEVAVIHCTDSRGGLRYMAHIDHDTAVDVQEIFRILERFAESRKRSSALDRVGTVDKTVI